VRVDRRGSDRSRVVVFVLVIVVADVVVKEPAQVV
jgi:hypothetical protein